MALTKNKLESFIESLLQALVDPKFDHMACWTTDGSAVVLCFDPVRGPFLDSLLYRHFRNMRADSFERQLRHYGFKQLIDRRRKVERPGTDYIHEQLVPESMRNIAPAALMILCHPNFHRDNPQAWRLMKRRRTHKVKPALRLQDSPPSSELKTPSPRRPVSNLASYLPEILLQSREDEPASTISSWSPKSESSTDERHTRQDYFSRQIESSCRKLLQPIEPLHHYSSASLMTNKSAPSALHCYSLSLSMQQGLLSAYRQQAQGLYVGLPGTMPDYSLNLARDPTRVQ